VAFGPEGEGFQTQQQEEGVKGAQAGADVSQVVRAGLDDEGRWAEGLDEVQTMVAGGRLGHERVAPVGPVKTSTVDNGASDDSTVSANPFRGRVNHDRRAVLDGLEQSTSHAKGVIHE